MSIPPYELDATAAAGLSCLAARIDDDLRYTILPYWLRTTPDQEHGGYLLADGGSGRTVPREKLLVSQARLLWVFSQAHQFAGSETGQNYLAAAATGYQFLQRHFLDPAQGGYYWQTDRAGHVLNAHKNLYGQAFVILALVEYHRAARDPVVLVQALQLFAVVQRQCRDLVHGGWREHFAQDWQPHREKPRTREVDVPGWKSGNAHMHLLEALAELYEVTRDTGVKSALAEALRCTTTYFFPREAGQACLYRDEAFQPIDDPRQADLSYGHNVEFAWLMLRAEQVLGRELSLPHFEALLTHALRHGFDAERGGLYHRGRGCQPAHHTDKIWWVQAELLSALTVGLQLGSRAAGVQVLTKLLQFIRNHQADPADGAWLDTVTADGRPKCRAKAHAWKAGYHEVRALVKFVRAFGAPAPPLPSVVTLGVN